MANYDFKSALSPIDFEHLSKDLLEAELGIRFENFREGRDRGIDLRYAPAQAGIASNQALVGQLAVQTDTIVQCKRYSNFSDLKSALKREEVEKVAKLNPRRYILTTSVSLSPEHADELRSVLSPFVISTDDIYGRERLNALLLKHPEIERRHIKLWLSSAGVLEAILNAGTYSVSREEIERTIVAAQIYVKNPSFDEALEILRQHHVCIISGIPGIGKTTLARMLLLYFYRHDFEIIKIESDISEARQVPYHNRPRFYYYDDFLGQTAQADKLSKNEDQKLLDFMTSVQDAKHAVFVLTTREYILNQARLQYEKLAREKLDYRKCVMDLSKYSRRIRAEILYNHLYFSSLPREHLYGLISQRGYLKIVDHENYNPRLIEYMTNPQWIGNVVSADYLSLFLRNLDNPELIWEHAFDYQITDASRHLLLILVTLPTESQITDVEEAFVALHGNRSVAGSRRQGDFTRALKELDGTFISTRRVGEDVLLQFHNASIRDFVRGRVLKLPLLEEILESCVFFEQAQWVADILFDERRYVARHVAAQCTGQVANALKRLATARSCIVKIQGYGPNERAVSPTPNRVERLAEIAEFSRRAGDLDERDFINSRLADLEAALVSRQIDPASCLVAIAPLRQLGILSDEQGRRFALALKTVTSRPREWDEFKTLGRVVEALPELFDEAERRDIGDALSIFAEQFVTDYEDGELEVDNPEEIREDAVVLEALGDTFEIDTRYLQERLHKHADHIEGELQDQRDWGRDERRTVSRGPECPDTELDSMFRTLAE